MLLFSKILGCFITSVKFSPKYMIRIHWLLETLLILLNFIRSLTEGT
jgi:hypothetical protein